MCDLLILAAKTDPNAAKPAAGMSLFLVDTSTEGFSRGKNLSKIGMKAQVSRAESMSTQQQLVQ